MANKTGAKWNKGGSMARKRSLDIDFSQLGSLIEKLENLDADIEKIVGDAMEEAGEQVQQDTIEALAPAYLPAKGKYSHGETEASVVRDVKVTWGGSIGEMDLGFDKTKPGAGGFLITGTPKMEPDKRLEDIYSRKKTSRAYEKRIVEKIGETLQEEIDKRMG